MCGSVEIIGLTRAVSRFSENPALVGCSQSMRKTTQTKRPVGDRESFRGDELQLLNGTLYVRTSGLRLGRSLASVPFSALVTLTVTSAKLERVGRDLVTVCSGPCGERLPLHHMGLLRAGKTFLARALAYRVCQAARRVVVTSATRMVNELAGAEIHG